MQNPSNQPITYNINYEPRSKITLTTGVSFIAKLFTVGGYMAGVFKQNIAATALNVFGYGVGWTVDNLSDHDQQEHIATLRDNFDRDSRDIAHKIDVQLTDTPNTVRDQIGLEADYCETPAGQVSSTVRVLAGLCQLT